MARLGLMTLWMVAARHSHRRNWRQPSEILFSWSISRLVTLYVNLSSKDPAVSYPLTRTRSGWSWTASEIALICTFYHFCCAFTLRSYYKRVNTLSLIYSTMSMFLHCNTGYWVWDIRIWTTTVTQNSVAHIASVCGVFINARYY